MRVPYAPGIRRPIRRSANEDRGTNEERARARCRCVLRARAGAIGVTGRADAARSAHRGTGPAAAARSTENFLVASRREPARPQLAERSELR